MPTTTPHRLTPHVVATEAELRALIGEPAPLTGAKVGDRLNPMTRLFVERVEGKAPRLGILVDIEQAYTQCSKAFMRSQFWDPARHVDPRTMPTGGQVHRAIQGEGFDAAAYDAERAERYAQRVGFY